MKQFILIISAVMFGLTAQSFCGFYVTKVDAKLFNKSSQIILVRDGDRSTITMSNDFQGSVRDFAMVVPVPVVLQERDIKVVNSWVFDRLDAYSGPRLVEYYDQNPCYQREYELMEMAAPRRSMNKVAAMDVSKERTKALGVSIEASYSVGEYDILVLSATESDGLKIWLREAGYKIPYTANEVLDPYIRSNMKFFVVKVNLDSHASMGYKELRPIQISFNSDRFMLPIRLGMANAQGEQDMIVYAFSRRGRIETTNYRTVKIPSNRNIPLFVRKDFGRFYKDLFDRSYRYEGRNSVFLEYAWNVTPSWGGVKCDPCVGPPPMNREFAEAGVNINGANRGQQLFFTRLHVRYSRDRFPQDLQFQETPNREHFQGRYIMTHPANGSLDCDAGQRYLRDLVNRRQRELDELASLTGWDVSRHWKYVDHYRTQLHDDSYRNDLPGIFAILPRLPKDPMGLLVIPVGIILTVLILGVLSSRRRKTALVT